MSKVLMDLSYSGPKLFLRNIGKIPAPVPHTNISIGSFLVKSASETKLKPAIIV